MRFIGLSFVCVFVVAACGGSEASVGDPGTSNEQRLQTRKDGGATGNGATCSWEGTSIYESVAGAGAGAGATRSGPVPGYSVGDEFTSIDGCNDCVCVAKGIMCTVRACSQPPGNGSSGGEACPAIARVCKDSSPPKQAPGCKQICPEDEPQACDASLRVCKDNVPPTQGPGCQQICPEDGATGGCTKELKVCPDGKTSVGRTGPSCEFAPCPDLPVACTADAKKCPDGSYVGRTGPSCEFAPCPK